MARGPGVYFEVVIGDDGAGQRPQLVTLSEEDDMARLGLIAALIGWGCGTSGDKTDGDTAGGPDGGWRPDLVCPGDAGCVSGEGALEAGAAAVSITPTCFEQWLDCGRDGILSRRRGLG